jgi:hypothetical protein
MTNDALAAHSVLIFHSGTLSSPVYACDQQVDAKLGEMFLEVEQQDPALLPA